MKRTALLTMLMLAAFLYACSSKEPGSAPKAVHKVGMDPLKALIVEQETFNIPWWLESGAKGRVLVRFSAIDGLAPVKEETLAMIKNAADVRDYKAITAMGNVLSRDGAAYSPANTAYLAHRLGIAGEVYWVVPTFASITQADLDGFKGYLKKRLPGQEKDIDTLALVDKAAIGRINGVPVRMMGIKDLPAVDKPVVLDIDNSYFSALYKNEKETRVLGFVSGFFAELKDRRLTSDLVSLSASNADGSVPLRFRFITLYVWELLNKPGIIDGQPPADWSDRADAWKAEERSPKEAVAIYKNIVKEYPQDSASHYDLSGVYFKLGDLENCRKELAQAVKLDPVYAMAYADYANRLTAKGRKAEAERFFAELGGK